MFYIIKYTYVVKFNTCLSLFQVREMKELSTILSCAAVLLCCGYSCAISFKSQNLKSIDVKVIQNSGDRDVYLQDNLLDSLDSDMCTIVPKIELLHVSKNQLQALDVSSCFVLKHLYAYDNKLSWVNLSKASSLVEVDVSRNALKMPPDLSAAADLRYLNLAHNQIDQLMSGVFDDNLLLSLLDLSHNRVARLTDNVFTTSGNLVKLFMDHNLISTLPDNIFDFCPNLKVVSLSHNIITTLNPSLFSKNPGLVQLDISNNQLVEIELTGDLPRLVFLDASNNDLFNVTLPRHLPRLRRADFSYNTLVQVNDHVVGYTGAYFYLDVSYNNISDVDVGSFDLRTKTIVLDGNPLLCLGDKLADTVLLPKTMALRARRMCV